MHLFKRENGARAFRFAAVLLPVFILIAVLNFMTPYTVDDFCYMFSFADFHQRITNIGQIFPSMAAHYQSINGRVIPHFVVQVFLMEGMSKAVFNIVNTLVFLALGAAIFFFANVERAKRTPARLLGVYLLLFILMMLALLIQTGKVTFLRHIVFEGSFEKYLVTGVFMAACVAANYAMLVVPFYADRSAIGVCAFAAVSVCVFASCFKVKKNNWFTVGIGAFVTAGTLALALSILPGMADFGQAGKIRQEAILEAYENGEETVEIDIIVAHSRYMSSYGLLDFRPGSEGHVNDVTRQRMGLDIIGRKKWVECRISTVEKVKNKAIELFFQ